MSDREIRVTFPGGLKVDAAYKGFVIKTDQPVHQGGEGTAPAPFDLFLASIATCAGFYTVAFCRERGIPMEGAGVTMHAEKDPETKMISKIRIELHLPAGFPEKYMRAVIKAVDYCTVKAHILKAPAFEITAEIPKQL
jgi:ribosomal protein S12 methylthiotransferase accessory factor